MIAIVKTNIAPLYFGCDASCALQDELLHGMLVNITEENGEFYKVRTHYSYNGYVMKSNFETSNSKAVFWQKQEKLQVVFPFADVHIASVIQSKIIISLPRGALVIEVNSSENKPWKKIMLADGTIGFCKAKYVNCFFNNINKTQEEIRICLFNNARVYLGAPYRWGGKTFLGIDCSGLVSMAYMLSGIAIYRDAKYVNGFGLKRININNAKKGDLLYFPGHVAMYIGNGKIIHSTDYPSSEGVCIAAIIKGEKSYREDLANNIISAASMF